MTIETIDELLAYAERHRTPDCTCQTCAPLHAVVDLFETPFPCGWPKPEVSRIQSARGDYTAVAWDSIAGYMTAEEARAIGVALIRAADQAKAAG